MHGLLSPFLSHRVTHSFLSLLLLLLPYSSNTPLFSQKTGSTVEALFSLFLLLQWYRLRPMISISRCDSKEEAAKVYACGSLRSGLHISLSHLHLCPFTDSEYLNTSPKHISGSQQFVLFYP